MLSHSPNFQFEIFHFYTFRWHFFHLLKSEKSSYRTGKKINAYLLLLEHTGTRQIYLRTQRILHDNSTLFSLLVPLFFDSLHLPPPYIAWRQKVQIHSFIVFRPRINLYYALNVFYFELAQVIPKTIHIVEFGYKKL